MRRPNKIHYLTELKHVREVSLIGTGDLRFWVDYLKNEGLTPVALNDMAQVLIVSATMNYLGIGFTETSFSIRAMLLGEPEFEGMRLLHAFTSSRLFAWCEQRIFLTPYRYGKCRNSVQNAPSIRLDVQDECILDAEMSHPLSAPVRDADACWEGPVFLPPSGAKTGHCLFFARLSGQTVVFPVSNADRVACNFSGAGQVLQPLADCNFSAQQWLIRANANHGRSKTLSREKLSSERFV